jgi:hypothetical protein
MADISAIGHVNGLVSGWVVEIVGGSVFPQGTYSMIEIDLLKCAFRRPGGPSFEMSAEDVVHYEKTVFLQVVGTVAANDNGDAVRSDPRSLCRPRSSYRSGSSNSARG